MSKDVTKAEVIALRASVQVILEQTEKILAKMEDTQPKKRGGVTEQQKAEVIAGMHKTMFKARLNKQAQKNTAGK